MSPQNSLLESHKLKFYATIKTQIDFVYFCTHYIYNQYPSQTCEMNHVIGAVYVENNLARN